MAIPKASRLKYLCLSILGYGVRHSLTMILLPLGLKVTCDIWIVVDKAAMIAI